MFITVKNCGGKGDCIKSCPTEAIRHIGGKSFSCICCGACAEACPNHAIFKNKYGGYVVDKARCNGCGVCEFTCPIESIHIENGVVKGICSRCGVCEEVCPDHARMDAYGLVEDKQQKLLNSLKAVIPKAGRAKLESMNIPSKSEKVAKRICVNTNVDECELCGRCSYYCPTGAIKVNIEQEGICTNCRICEDVCPSGAIKAGVVNPDKCSLCLSCYHHCTNDAIVLDNFAVVVNKLNQKMNGTIISCLNCGLCSETLDNGSIKKIKSSLRYDPSLDEDNYENKEKRLLAVEICPVGSLRETEKSKLAGLCVTCGLCIEKCDQRKARNIETITWNGEVSDDCISCGICAELCPENAITIKRGSVNVDLDKCIMCETCGVHCPKDAIPKTTAVKKEIAGGFNYLDENLCIKCGLCKDICPEEAIKAVPIDSNIKELTNNTKYVVNDEECTYCGACRNVCPSKAFIFERKFKDVTK